MPSDQIKNELVAISAITVVSFLTFTQLDVLELVVSYSEKYEYYEIDELISTSFVLTLCLTVFSIRRWREALRYNKLLIDKNNQIIKANYQIKVLKGTLTTCSYCKKIKDSDGSWKQLEVYIDSHSEAQFSHGLCPECSEIPLKELEEILENQSHQGSP